ncbi:DoxX family protein [Aquimarina spongiae]|uniref:DoxX-like family protein n=1 Tax=Aquimarina spongiae TaxID=570521 RepID=A0A1M6GPL1_9FLAO|nr:DoxX family protein [Aquimarina spongiae]SHJ11874.1 DoxX-like family protein [Aquimarina spongiae]
MSTIIILTYLSAISFIFYGINCLVKPKMKSEFIRFGLQKWRTLTGTLQLIGGFGLVIGLYVSPLLTALSALGLGILMFMGFGVRISVGDNMLLSFPALIFGFLNIFLSFYYSTTIYALNN